MFPASNSSFHSSLTVCMLTSAFPYWPFFQWHYLWSSSNNPSLWHLTLFNSSCMFFVFVFVFVFWECVCAHMCKWERGRERDSKAGSALSAWSPSWCPNPWTTSSWREPKSSVGRLTDWATQSVPTSWFLLHYAFFNFYQEYETFSSLGFLVLDFFFTLPSLKVFIFF